MRAITERLIFRESTSAELWVFYGAGGVAISIDELHNSRDAHRSALGINESLYAIVRRILRHGYGLVEIVAQRLRTRWVTKLGHSL